MTKEELEIKHEKLKQEHEGLRTEYGKLISRYRIVKAMIRGVMQEVEEPETQFQNFSAGSLLKPNPVQRKK